MLSRDIFEEGVDEVDRRWLVEGLANCGQRSESASERRVAREAAFLAGGSGAG